MLPYTLKISYEGSTSVFDYAEEIDAMDEPLAIMFASDAIQVVSQKLDWSVAILVDEDGDEVWRQTRNDTLP